MTSRSEDGRQILHVFQSGIAQIRATVVSRRQFSTHNKNFQAHPNVNNRQPTVSFLHRSNRLTPSSPDLACSPIGQSDIMASTGLHCSTGLPSPGRIDTGTKAMYTGPDADKYDVLTRVSASVHVLTASWSPSLCLPCPAHVWSLLEGNCQFPGINDEVDGRNSAFPLPTWW